MDQIYVTKTYLPEKKEFFNLIDQVWEKRYVTNNGPLACELQDSLKTNLGVSNLYWTANGTLALQIAINSLDLCGEIITTPFTYVATANSIVWEKCTPVFVDINPVNLSIDTSKIEEKITDHTSAILAVHIYGYPCDIDGIEKIAENNNIKVIYDASHTFGSMYRGKSLVSYGDISTLSFHATKVYHTIEGGCIISKDVDLAKRIKLAATHGHAYEDYLQVGTNAKNSELHAAVGILNLKDFNKILEGRKNVFNRYFEFLRNLDLQILHPDLYEDFEYNYSYLPVVFPTEQLVLEIIDTLKELNIFPRRYFHPSLNTLTYLNTCSCPVAEDISKRILCLPLYHDLEIHIVELISGKIKNHLCVGV